MCVCVSLVCSCFTWLFISSIAFFFYIYGYIYGKLQKKLQSLEDGPDPNTGMMTSDADLPDTSRSRSRSSSFRTPSPLHTLQDSTTTDDNIDDGTTKTTSSNNNNNNKSLTTRSTASSVDTQPKNIPALPVAGGTTTATTTISISAGDGSDVSSSAARERTISQGGDDTSPPPSPLSDVSFPRVQHSELVMSTDVVDERGRMFVPATLNGTAVVVKRISQGVLGQIIQREQNLLRVKSPNYLPYLAICMEPPSTVKLQMTRGAIDDWLYGVRARRRRGGGDGGGGGGGGGGSEGGGSSDGGETKDGSSSSSSSGASGGEEGDSIEAACWESTITDMQVAHWAVQLSSAVSDLHAENIVHGDIRGGNVLVDENMNIKVTGFLLQHEPPDDYALASSCLHWEAPEAFRQNIEEYTKMSDAYSLALTLYEMAVRSRPWDELTGKEVRVKVLEKERPNLDPLVAWIETFSGADAMKSVVKKCWADLPEERLEVCEIVEVLARMHSECQTMERRKKKEEAGVAAEAGVAEVGVAEVGAVEESSGDAKDVKEETEETEGDQDHSKEEQGGGKKLKNSVQNLSRCSEETNRPHSYPPQHNRRASSPASMGGQ